MNALAPTPAYFTPSLAPNAFAQPMASPMLYSIPAPAMANTNLSADTFQRTQAVGQTTNASTQTQPSLGIAEQFAVGVVAPAMQATDRMMLGLNNLLKGNN